MDLLQQTRQEYANRRLSLQITIGDLDDLIRRKTGQSMLAIDADPDLYTTIMRELADLAVLKQAFLRQNPVVEIVEEEANNGTTQATGEDGFN
jgi:hypothetical protein